MATVQEKSPTKSKSKTTFSRDASILQPITESRKLKINVGGQVHELFASTLKNIPNSPLAWILQENCKAMIDHDNETGELFFDRHPETFVQVLDYFQTGKLHHPRNVCGPMFEEELKFWAIEEQQMETCCWHEYTHHRLTQENLQIFKPKSEMKDDNNTVADIELGPTSTIQELSNDSQFKSMQFRIWQMLDKPQSSSAAKVLAWTSLGFVILSIITLTVYTMQHDAIKLEAYNSTFSNNTANSSAANTTAMKNKTTNYAAGHKTDLWIMFVPLEAICIVWFSLELILRAIFCPNKFRFLTSLSTILDTFALCMAYLLLLKAHQQSDIIEILNMARFFRISRFFKLIYSLHVLRLTLKASAYYFLTLLFLLIIPIILFSSIIFQLEKWMGSKKSKKSMKTIPNSFWWAIITMSTVGYGDAVPESYPGLFVGGAAAVLGVIILSLTSSILGSTFEKYYNMAQAQLKIPTHRNNQVNVPIESLSKMAGMQTQEISKASIKSGNMTYYSGRDSGYGNSPVSKQRGRSISHPPDKKQLQSQGIRGSMRM